MALTRKQNKREKFGRSELGGKVGRSLFRKARPAAITTRPTYTRTQDGLGNGVQNFSR